MVEDLVCFYNAPERSLSYVIQLGKYVSMMILSALRAATCYNRIMMPWLCWNYPLLRWSAILIVQECMRLSQDHARRPDCCNC